jgi:mannose-1-phosphate guanylyltransferase
MFEVLMPKEPALIPRMKKSTDTYISSMHQLSPSISALWKKADNVYVIPSSFGWSDLGTWNSAYENYERDYLGNAVAGNNVVVIDAARCMVHVPDEKLVLIQGLDDHIVVDTKDVLLICKKEKEQEIKDYVAEVKRNKGDKYL